MENGDACEDPPTDTVWTAVTLAVKFGVWSCSSVIKVGPFLPLNSPLNRAISRASSSGSSPSPASSHGASISASWFLQLADRSVHLLTSVLSPAQDGSPGSEVLVIEGSSTLSDGREICLARPYVRLGTSRGGEGSEGRVGTSEVGGKAVREEDDMLKWESAACQESVCEISRCS